MKKIKVISFDMDGTLIKSNFADLVWLDGIPRIYSEQYKIPFEKAKEKFILEYDKIGKDRIEWYDINYWFNKYHLNIKVDDLFKKYEDYLEFYPDVENILKFFNEKYTLIVSSNAPREFLDFNLKPVKHFFNKMFSSVSDYYLLKKDVNFYKNIIFELGISTSELVHVGDNYISDYQVPKNIGINSFYIDRKITTPNRDTILKLSDLKEKILEI